MGTALCYHPTACGGRGKTAAFQTKLSWAGSQAGSARTKLRLTIGPCIYFVHIFGRKQEHDRLKKTIMCLPIAFLSYIKCVSWLVDSDILFCMCNYFFISVLKGKVNRIQSNLWDTLEDDLKQTDYSVSALITVYIN